MLEKICKKIIKMKCEVADSKLRRGVYVPVTDESIFAAVVPRSSLSFVFLLYDKDGGGALYGGCLVRWC